MSAATTAIKKLQHFQLQQQLRNCNKNKKLQQQQSKTILSQLVISVMYLSIAKTIRNYNNSNFNDNINCNNCD